MAPTEPFEFNSGHSPGPEVTAPIPNELVGISDPQWAPVVSVSHPSALATDPPVDLQARPSTPTNGRGRSADSNVRGRGRRGKTPAAASKRGRGRGRGRARSRSSLARNDRPCDGWTIRSSECQSIVMEKVFVDEVIQQRARLLCSTAVNKMKLECTVRGITPTRSGFVVLFMNGLLHQLCEWLNEMIRMNNNDDVITVADMYRYVSVLLLSHTSGFSFDKSITILRQSGCLPPSVERVRFIADNVKAFSATGRGQDGSISWNSQRDLTRNLSEFEALAFRETSFSPDTVGNP